MKKADKLLTIVILSLQTIFITAKVQAQSMNIVLNSGTTQTYSITSASKIYFSDNNLIFGETNSSTSINQIRKITFSTATSVDNVSDNRTLFCVTPNPASSYVLLKNIPDENCTATIYSMTGAMMLSSIVSSSSNTVDVNSLPKGVYLVKVKNLTAKFIKL